MKKIIAFAGKGGTGKTTIAALSIRALAFKSPSLLAIDADPNNNLWQALGVAAPETVMDIVESVIKNPDSLPKGMSKQSYIDLKIQESVSESDGFDLLTMGRPEGPGCYCYANNLLRDNMDRLSKGYDIILIDNEAGMEHMSRRIAPVIDILFIVSDYSAVGVRSAGNIARLAAGLNIRVGQQYLIINKAGLQTVALDAEIGKTGIDVIGVVPYDDELDKISMEGGSVFQLGAHSQSMRAVSHLIGKAGEF